LSAKLFIDSDQLNKAKQTADDILKSTIKVESSATREIINEMNEIVTKSLTEKTHRHTEKKTIKPQ
ncbi:MAG: hypothetical protein GX387_14055, partial [Clostridium sp.]|nr:hypothetical protein [Clostridium sp.]